MEDLRLHQHNFYDIWGKERYGDLYEMTVGTAHYEKYNPCTECEHLWETCFPCPVHGMEKELLVIGKCRAYMSLLKEQEKEGEQNEAS